MNLSQKVTEDIYFVGGSDRRLALFENAFPIENGITYNSYLLLDDKNVLFDTVDNAIAEVFFDNITSVLAGKSLDYIVINHMEPDHSATLEQVVLRYPEVKIICNDKAKKMVGQFFGEDMTDRFVEVKEGSNFSTGKHNLRFIMMPMVHWPEAMAT
ncbi:MAG: FprA family A-type flavoprotein, partial [Oscillospiraceae bacterium]